MLLVLLWFQLGGAAAAGLEVEELPGGGDSASISHSLLLLQRLEALLLRGRGSDVTLRVETPTLDQVKVVQAHSLLLELQSSIFREMLLRHRDAEGPVSSSVSSISLLLTESAECAAVFDDFLRYLYRGEITVRLDQAIALHKLATKYQVLGLQQGLVQLMTRNLAQDSGVLAVSWYEYALQAEDPVLRDGCLRFLAWNLSLLLRSGRWACVSGRLILALLARSDLVVQSEMELFSALEDWIIRNQPDGLTTENALRSVRYAMMSPPELFRLQTESPVLAQYRESVRDLLYLSYQFHSAPPMQMARFFEVNCSLFMPRNYLGPAWGSAWTLGSEDRGTSFQTRLGPSSHDAARRLTWNALFSPRWPPLGPRTAYTEISATPTGSDRGRPRVVVTPASAGAELAGVTFQKTVLVMAPRRDQHRDPDQDRNQDRGRNQDRDQLQVQNVYDFHQSTEENGDFLDQDLSQYLVDGFLYLHIVVKPLYQTLIDSKT